MKTDPITLHLGNRAPRRIYRLAATIASLLLVCTPASAVTFVVNSTADPGDGVLNALECTLREAINAANANPGLDVIQFAIAPGGAQTIQLLSALPSIADPAVIDGTTQPGFSAAPLIEIDGSIAGGAAFRITAGASTVRALSLNQFSGCGAALENGDGNLVATDVTTGSGVLLVPSAAAAMWTESR
ncbi:MAG: CSLREA domain-containing protein [Verrucomicrobia bacterium]|nr:CSLREA domain-containing protein [Verrucomicrobiota bacterium]